MVNLLEGKEAHLHSLTFGMEAGQWEQNSWLLLLTPPEADVGSDGAEELRRGRGGSTGRAGGEGKSMISSTGASGAEGVPWPDALIAHAHASPLLLKPISMLNCSLLLLSNNARKCQNPSVWGEWTGEHADASPALRSAGRHSPWGNVDEKLRC